MFPELVVGTDEGLLAFEELLVAVAFVVEHCHDCPGLPYWPQLRAVEAHSSSSIATAEAITRTGVRVARCSVWPQDRANSPDMTSSAFVRDLRRIWATLLLCLGVSARVVIDILGHTQNSVNIYDHVMPATQHKATEQIDAALGSLDEAHSEDEDGLERLQLLLSTLPSRRSNTTMAGKLVS